MSNDKMTLNQRQAHWLCVAFLLMLLGAFMAGYFWGQRVAYRECVQKLVGGNFTDQASFALYTHYGTSENTEGNDQGESQPEAIMELSRIAADIQLITNEQNDEAVLPPPSDLKKSAYQAELVGFGSHEQAKACHARMKAKGYPVIIKERTSKSSKGKRVIWYQVCTQEDTDKDRLTNLVNTIKKTERIKDVNIVSHQGKR